MSGNSKGYTLIELIVVMVLIGLVFSLTAPRFRDAVLTDSLEKETLRLAGKVKELRSNAMQNHEDYLLVFDLESNMYWHGFANMTVEGEDVLRERNATQFPKDIRIVGISFQDKPARSSGEVRILISRKGYAQPSAIHLESQDGRKFSVWVKPFLPDVEVLEGYVKFGDEKDAITSKRLHRKNSLL
jgi:prepilin-type N-terminal cleavage/methylation domain-containing protein